MAFTQAITCEVAVSETAFWRWLSGDTANWFFRRFGAERLVKR